MMKEMLTMYFSSSLNFFDQHGNLPIANADMAQWIFVSFEEKLSHISNLVFKENEDDAKFYNDDPVDYTDCDY